MNSVLGKYEVFNYQGVAKKSQFEIDFFFVCKLGVKYSRQKYSGTGLYQHHRTVRVPCSP